MPNMRRSHKITILDKMQIEKKILISNSKLGELFNDLHFSMMNISIGQNCLNKKNPLKYIVPPLTSGVGTIIIIVNCLLLLQKQRQVIEHHFTVFLYIYDIFILKCGEDSSCSETHLINILFSLASLTLINCSKVINLVCRGLFCPNTFH